MKLDILVFAAHPDDAELCCSGTIAAHIASNKKVGIVDLTEGEMGTRGTSEIRLQEASDAAKILGLSIRENLGYDDGFFDNTRETQLGVIKMIRKYQPEIVLANAISDRHPDHGRAAQLVYRATFLSGLARIETTNGDESQQPWRPAAVYHYIQSLFINPDFVVDISRFWDKKLEAVKAFKSQFHDPNSSEAETYISNPDFLLALEARAKEFGHSLGVKYGEGFCKTRNLGVSSLFDLI